MPASDYAAVSSYRRRPVPMVGIGPGLCRKIRKIFRSQWKARHRHRDHPDPV